MSDSNNAPEWVEIERTFAAPVSLVWQMWTSGEHFGSWYGPMGATISTSELDLQVGGKRKVCMEMETPNGPMQMWFVGEVLEIVENERFVYTELVADADGNPLPPSAMGMPDDHDMTTQVVVELSEADGSTTMKMTHVGVPAGSPGGMGWGMAIDKLEAALAS